MIYPHPSPERIPSTQNIRFFAEKYEPVRYKPLLSALIACIILIFLSLSLSAQDWVLAKEKNGIKVFTRKEAGNDLKSFRATMVIRSTMDRITKLVGNVHNQEWWDEDVKKVDVLYFEENKHIKYYLIYDLPWPMSDRDLCVDAKITIDPVTRKREIYATPLANVVPEKPDLVRIKKYWQKWTIIPQDNGMMSLTLEGFVDPAGSVPSWLYNMVMTDAPLKVMSKVKDQCEIK
jgi:hypothetical protein